MESREQVDAVQRMQDYIESNINCPITLYDLSRCAGYSPFHCARVFKELVGKPPFEYIRTLRLSRAALKLRDEKKHEGFTRAFSKEFGITPLKYKKTIPFLFR